MYYTPRGMANLLVPVANLHECTCTSPLIWGREYVPSISVTLCVYMCVEYIGVCVCIVCMNVCVCVCKG